MTSFSTLRIAITAGTLTLLAACGGGSGETITLKTPTFFSGKVDGATMNGLYNPNGYSAVQVKTLVSNVCASGRVSGFAREQREDGLVSFAASCREWNGFARFVEFEKTTGNQVLIEITGAQNGNLTYSKITADL